MNFVSQPSPPSTDVLIVGAGPAGLTLAAALARAGVRPRIIDKNTVPPADRSRAMVIQPRTLELFDDLGIVEQALEAGLSLDGLTIVSRDGSRAHTSLRGELDSPYLGIFSLPQDQTERILGELVTRLGVSVEHGVSLEGFTDDGHAITASLERADGSRETALVRWIVGCDGAHSTVRSVAGLTFDGVTYPDECLLGDIVVDWDLPHDAVSLCPVGQGLLLAFPLPGEKHFRVIMIIPRDVPAENHDTDRHLERGEFEATLREMLPRSNGAKPRMNILESFWLTRYRLHRRGVPAYRKGRALVAGDAAHIHSPAGGQGMNTGIQDAYNLAWKLALVVRGAAPESLLDTYDSERRRIGEILLHGTDRMFAVMASDGILYRALRHLAPTIAASMFELPIVGRKLARFVSELGIRYRQSPLSVEGPTASTLGAAAPVAGDLALDAELSVSSKNRLFDLLRGPEHTLLLFAGSDDARAEAFARLAAQVRDAHPGLLRTCVIVIRDDAPYGLPDVALDDGVAHAKYGASGGAIYLVRPDWYVAFRGGARDGAALIADLERRFAS